MTRLNASNRNVALLTLLGVEPDDVVLAEQITGFSHFIRVRYLKRDERGLPIPLGPGQGYMTGEVTFSTQQVREAAERLDSSTNCDSPSAGDTGSLHSTLITPPQHP